jgi:hypothetical protein
MSKFNRGSRSTRSQPIARGGDAEKALRDKTARAFVGEQLSQQDPEVRAFFESIIGITPEEIEQAQVEGANIDKNFRGDTFTGTPDVRFTDEDVNEGVVPDELYRPNIKERQAASRAGETPNYQLRRPEEKPTKSRYFAGKEFKSASSYDGGLTNRLKKGLINIHTNGLFRLGTNPVGQTYPDAAKVGKGTNIDGVYTPPPQQSVSPKIQQAAVQEQTGSNKSGDYDLKLVRAIMKGGGLAYNKDVAEGSHMPSQDYDRVALLVTENAIADRTYLAVDDFEVDPITGEKITDETREQLLAREQVAAEEKRLTTGVSVTMAAGNGALGNQIHQEWLRLNPDLEKTKLTREEAETLGSGYKELYANLNPDILQRVETKFEQTEFRLLDSAVPDLIAGQSIRQALFPKQVIKPLTAPMFSGTISEGDMANFTKVVLGPVGEKQVKEILKAFKNLGSVGHVVDKRRNKILLSTLLRHLNNNDVMSWEAEIHGMGETKNKEYLAKEKFDTRQMLLDGYVYNDEIGYYTHPNESYPDIHPSYMYNASEVMNNSLDSYAQQVHAIQAARNQISYLTFAALGYNQRLIPQQTHFNPVTSKVTRYVTRAARPDVIKPASIEENNLRQMYAAILVDGTAKKLDRVREEKLRAATPKLREWGNILRELQQVSDSDYEMVADAIANKIPLNDPAWPVDAANRVAGSLQLDPQQHGELMAAIKAKGGFEGLVYIDGLIDFANYMDARTAGKNFTTFFNAYPDGITNGIASNAVQMGHRQTAKRTGIIRENDVGDLLDDGDIRDAVARTSLASIGDGWNNIKQDSEEGITMTSHLNTVANELYGFKDLNKSTTMVYGYGMELQSFWIKFRDSLNLKLEYDNPDLKHAYEYLMSKEAFDNDLDALSVILNEKYSVSLEDTMSTDAIQSRRLVRAAAGMHIALDENFRIDLPLGKGAYGRYVSEGQATADVTTFNIYEPEGYDAEGNVLPDPETGKPRLKKQARKSVHYKRRMTAAAAKPAGGGKTFGKYAYGGALPGPIQALDAVTIVKTATGKSWNDISNAGGGNPYMFSIYDAVKVTAGNMHVVLDEINNNWFNESMKYSYLQAMRDATVANMKKFRQNKAKVLKEMGDQPIPIIKAGYMHQVLQPTEFYVQKDGSKKPNFAKSPLTKQLSKMAAKPEGKVDAVTGRPITTDSQAFFNQVRDFARGMYAALKKVGFDYRINEEDYGLPELEEFAANTTYRQYYAFVEEFYRLLDFESRMNKMIAKTNANKKLLAEELKKNGHKSRSGRMVPRQYEL